MKFLILIFCCVFSYSLVFSNDSIKLKSQSTLNNSSPLNNLTAFSVLPLSPPLDPAKKHLCDTVDKIVHTKLSYLGDVIEMSTNDPTGFGISGFFLSFNIQKVENINDAKSRITQISLSIPTIVTVKKTKQDCISYIWTKDVLVENDEDINIEKGIKELLEQFSTSYREANSTDNKRPTFYVYR